MTDHLTENEAESGTLVALLVLFFPVVLWEAFVTVKLWAWYIVPGFSVKPLSIVTAFGVILLYTMYRPSKVNDKPITWQWIIRWLGRVVFTPLLYLVFGAIGASLLR